MTTASKTAKKAGLKSLEEMSTISTVPTRTLKHWFKKRATLFKVLLEGCLK